MQLFRIFLLGLDTILILSAMARPDVIAPAVVATLHLLFVAALLAYWYRDFRQQDVAVLPREEVPDLRPARIEMPAPADAPTNGHMIFLVEDEADLRVLLERILLGSGYAVKSAPTADAALRMAKDLDRPDLLLCDFSLPDLDGMSLSVELRRQWPNLPVLFTSGAPDRLEGLERSGNAKIGTLLKPFLPDQLLEEIDRLVERRQRSARG